MPTYTAKCISCSHEQDFVSKIDDRDNTPQCSVCNSKTNRILTATMITAMGIADHYAIRSPIDGSMLYGKSDYNKHLKKHGVVPESEMKGEAAHQKKQAAKQEKAKRIETIQKAIAQHGAS